MVSFSLKPSEGFPVLLLRTEFKILNMALIRPGELGLRQNSAATHPAHFQGLRPFPQLSFLDLCLNVTGSRLSEVWALTFILCGASNYNWLIWGKHLFVFLPFRALKIMDVETISSSSLCLARMGSQDKRLASNMCTHGFFPPGMAVSF